MYFYNITIDGLNIAATVRSQKQKHNPVDTVLGAKSLTEIYWIRGYARTSVAAKLWALRDGINLCLSLTLPAVEIELDAKLVVDLLSKSEESSNAIDYIILADCKEGLSRISLVKIQHCYRKANKCADTLARRVVLLSQDFVAQLRCYWCFV
uniref:RNase H type-1 domain-containing protein n=1 Tax=Quercus lobata TaxID=97700 RepID=A0A7N2MXA7_QUELO